METPAYNWSPVLHLMLMGVVIAMGPLCWVWLRHRHANTAQRFRQITLLTLFLTFDLVLFGSFTRLTDSGLGCPDWPGCYGHLSPVGAKYVIAEAQAAMPSGPVSAVKAWIEMLHRYLATGVGVLILTIAIFSWMSARFARLLPSITLLVVCMQGAFGAWTVTFKLQPAIVTLHLLGAMVLLVLLTRQWVRQMQSTGDMDHSPASPHLRLWLVLTSIALLIQLVLGAWVSTNYAVLACDQFPQCQNSWWPEMDFSIAFEIWRPLGFSSQGDTLTFSSLTAIHYTHRLMAYILMCVVLVLAWVLNKTGWTQIAGLLFAVLVLQFITGISNVVFSWPLIAAVIHTGGAAALVILITTAWTCTSDDNPNMASIFKAPHHS